MPVEATFARRDGQLLEVILLVISSTTRRRSRLRPHPGGKSRGTGQGTRFVTRNAFRVMTGAGLGRAVSVSWMSSMLQPPFGRPRPDLMATIFSRVFYAERIGAPADAATRGQER
jgi:hypothetical protein